ncbi:MAG TPA: aromatic ring-hydroxylating dioxygenase subunit alpha [Nannocystaceae bacterium]|nr:aromatic ring-hydroxylating dioxygenase subunit alpha [Nannocystaceae bacterium]
MERATQVRLTQRLRAELEGEAPEPWPSFTIPAARYVDAIRCEREQAVLFGDARRRWPRIVATAAEITAGACVPVDARGVAAVLTRDAAGRVHAFANACRHRGTRLVDGACAAKAMVCPYHGWTYDLTGALIHVPHAHRFPGLELAGRGLVELPVAERHGLVWLGRDAEQRLAPLDADLAALGLDQHVVWRRARSTRRCNWKLVIEAFLDGYHLRVLHRSSIYPFFLDAASIAEPVGPHIRAVTARRALRDAPRDLDRSDLHALGTPSFVVFPSTVIIEHPDFVSLVTVEPLAVDVTDWDHVMMIPASRAAETEHWDRSWALIEEEVFQREDLWVCEQIQRSLAAGATDELLFGALENAVAWFHERLERELGDDAR